MDQITLRPATEADAAEIARLLALLCAHEGDPTDNITEGAVARDICGPDRALDAIVADGPGGGLSGVVLWRACYETAYAARGGFVSDLYVDAPARRKGVARRLLAAVAAEVARQGGVFLWLTAHSDNAKANALYRAAMNVHAPRITAHALTDDAFTELAAEGTGAGASVPSP